MLKLIGKKIFKILSNFFCLSKSMHLIGSYRGPNYLHRLSGKSLPENKRLLVI